MDVFRPNDSFVASCLLSPSDAADTQRFLFVGVIGSSVAVISILCNSLLLYVFSTSRRLRRQNYANPVMLALFDIFVSACYILLNCVYITAYHYHYPVLVNIWVYYVQYVYVVKHICETICNFLLVVASLERLFANSPEGKQKSILVFMVRRKVPVFVVLLLIAVFLKGTLLFETAIQHLPQCPEMERYTPVQSTHVDLFAPVIFWIRKIITVVGPFVMLIYCNSRIVCELKSKQSESQKQSIKKRSTRGSLTSSSIRKHYLQKKGVRTATQTLLAVVGCYLFSNILSTGVNFCEFVNLRLIQQHYYQFLVLSDVALLTTVVGCALRLPIYCISDVRIRKAIGRAFFRFRYKALPMDMHQNQLDKWSIVVVSNSLRSNLTNMNNPLFASQDWLGNRSKRAKDELAFLLQNRRKILVDMTLRLAMDPARHYERETGEDWLTDIQEEDSHHERRHSKFRAIHAEIARIAYDNSGWLDLPRTSNHEIFRKRIVVSPFEGIPTRRTFEISILCNSLLLYVFSTSRRLRRQNYANPVMLALFDIFVSACYILLNCVYITAYHYHYPVLVIIWVYYVQYVYVVKHICETICNFLLVVANLERLFAKSPEGKQKSILVFMVRRKVPVFVVLLLIAVFLKGTLLFETAIQHLPQCPEMERYTPVQSTHVDLFAPVIFWIRKIITVVGPFVMLIYCNSRIVCELKSKQSESQKQSIKKRSTRGSLTSSSIRKHYLQKKGVRTATQTLLAVVGCYLFSNILSTGVNFCEFVNLRLIQQHYYRFLVLPDVALLTTVVGCALRLPIYCISDVRIRKAIGRAFFRFRYKALPMDMHQNQLDKWSIVVVSNSLRSNLTNMNNPLFASQDWLGNRSKRAKDELAFLLQNRRKILVDMTLRLAMDPARHYERETGEDWLTDIQEEGSHHERRHSKFRAIHAEV